jgi:hypothetical protein
MFHRTNENGRKTKDRHDSKAKKANRMIGIVDMAGAPARDMLALMIVGKSKIEAKRTSLPEPRDDQVRVKYVLQHLRRASHGHIWIGSMHLD